MSATERTTFADQKGTYQAALISLFVGKAEDTEADLESLFHPAFTLRDDDKTYDYAAWVKHVRWLRGFLPKDGVKLEVTVFLKDGLQRAERHVSSTTLADGTVMSAETFQFVELADDGRMLSIVETVNRK